MLSREQVIKKIISEDDNIFAEIKKQPQTYNTILKEFKDNGTFQQILRRRIARMLKEQRIWRLRIPWTRFGKALFVTPNHTYKILISPQTTKVFVYYMFGFEQTDDELILKNYWELSGDNWNKWQQHTDDLRIKKHVLRAGKYIIWE